MNEYDRTIYRGAFAVGAFMSNYREMTLDEAVAEAKVCGVKDNHTMQIWLNGFIAGWQK